MTGSSQPKIYDRDGHELGEFVKGDMYIRDLTHTKGHQYHCYSGQWHPSSKCRSIAAPFLAAAHTVPACCTCTARSSVHLLSIGTYCCCCSLSVQAHMFSGHRCKQAVTDCLVSCAYRETVATCAHDGTVRLWDANLLKQKTVLKPTLRRSGRTAITTCCYNAEGSVIAGGLVEGSIQLWDVKGDHCYLSSSNHVLLASS